MLNRFLAGKQEEKRGPRAKRPYLATECTDLSEADKWRQQILREIGKKVMEIQNAGLGEHRCVWLQHACMHMHTCIAQHWNCSSTSPSAPCSDVPTCPAAAAPTAAAPAAAAAAINRTVSVTSTMRSISSYVKRATGSGA